MPVIERLSRQLVKTGYLKEFMVDSRNRGTGQGAQKRGNLLPPLFRVTEVIHTASKGTPVTRRKGMLAIVPVEDCLDRQLSKKKMKFTREPIAFNDDDLEGMIQPLNDALVVIAQTNGFIVKRVIVDQGNGADVMYPNLFKGLGLKNEDLSKYDMPLVGFDGQVVISRGKFPSL